MLFVSTSKCYVHEKRFQKQNIFVFFFLVNGLTDLVNILLDLVNSSLFIIFFFDSYRY